MKNFKEEVNKRIANNKNNIKLRKISSEFIKESINEKYSYNFSWLGRPVIQYPQDILALQEIFWKVKPDLIIETGIAHGGSIIFSASIMALLDLIENEKEQINYTFKRKVLAIDIDIRKHNKKAINDHPLSQNIILLEGSSISDDIIQKVYKIASNFKNILVILDSNHEHEHVLKELQIYSKLVGIGSYCVVFDTVIEELPNNYFKDRNWKAGNSPKTAVSEFLKDNNNFKIDKDIQNKLLITVASDGYLKKING